jgi:hypothetical protein
MKPRSFDLYPGAQRAMIADRQLQAGRPQGRRDQAGADAVHEAVLAFQRDVPIL